MGEATGTRRDRSVPVGEIAKGMVIKRTVHGKTGPWRVRGKMQTSKGSYGVTVTHVETGEDESFVLGPRGAVWVLEGER